MEARNQKYSCPDSDEQLDYWWYHVLKGEKKNVRRGTELRKKIEHSIFVYMCSKFP